MVNSGGVTIPVTLAYHKDKLTNTTPVFLYVGTVLMHDDEALLYATNH